MLTKELGNIESGTFASVDTEGRAIIQFFVNKDDAVMYNTQLEAIGQELHITETDSEAVDKMYWPVSNFFKRLSQRYPMAFNP